MTKFERTQALINTLDDISATNARKELSITDVSVKDVIQKTSDDGYMIVSARINGLATSWIVDSSVSTWTYLQGVQLGMLIGKYDVK